MFKIGDFSRLSQVSVKTLRFYDEMGLLKPGEVDEFTGYRYYSADQMPKLYRILAVKDLGLSLEQIREMLNDGLSASEIRDMLKAKKAEIEQTLMDEEARLMRIRIRMSQIELEDKMPKYDVLLKTLEPRLVASIRQPMDDSTNLGALFAETAKYIDAEGAKQAGPGIILYHDAEDGLEAETAFPISTALAGNERVKVYELPRVEHAACLVYKGTHEAMGEASRAIANWIEDNGYRVSGPNRVLFLECADDESAAGESVVETQFPVEKA